MRETSDPRACAAADTGGWRLVFALAAGAMLALRWPCVVRFPAWRPASACATGELLRSVLSLIAAEPFLRRRPASACAVDGRLLGAVDVDRSCSRSGRVATARA
jgi:hypothetical protein